MKEMIVKVCGMRDGENIREVAELGVQWIGMIFWDKSPRNVTMIPTYAGIIPDRSPLNPQSSAEVSQPSTLNPQRTAEVTQHSTLNPQPSSPLRVGVFVDEIPQNIITRVVNFKLDLVQFHGNESPTAIRNLRRTLDPDIRPGIRFIKAISVGCREDIDAYKQYEDCVDYFLFDTRSPSVGGSGEHFDWSLLDAYDGDKPFLLSGGIGPDDAGRVLAFHHPRCIGIDLNSRFETAPGIKDTQKLKQFLDQL